MASLPPPGRCATIRIERKGEAEPVMALVMKPSCEKCETGLPADLEAYICSYECTFCRDCTKGLEHRCPNCGGELVRRPRRRPDPEQPAIA